MRLTRSTNIRLARISIVVLVAGLIVAYAVWRSLNYARGPEIEIFQPAEGASIASSTVVIRGRANRINSLRLDGNDISVDEQGDFSQTLVLFPGLNTIALEANDQFGRSVSKVLELVGTMPLPAATTDDGNASTSSR